jgi:DNA processing protein
MKTDRLGPARIKKLIDRFGTAEKVFNQEFESLTETEGIDEILAKSILKQTKNLSTLTNDYEDLLNKISKIECKILTYEDEDYPELLKTIYDPPVILYYKGNLNSVNGANRLANCIAVVGTRRPTDYGKHTAERFAYELSSLGITIVSGFARGIDTIVHRTVLDRNNNGNTTAVFGNGIDVVYPPENGKLYERMTEQGLMISEYDPGTGPDAVNFPRRNRIISGSSLGVLVIESGKDGGALITARCALDQSREVFAVPGYITSKFSAGTNSLIKNGMAKLVENTEDLLEELSGRLNVIYNQKQEKQTEAQDLGLKKSEKIIYELIYNGTDSVDIDSISEITGLNISDCLVSLLNLEFKGIVKQLPGKRFMRVY